MPIETNKSYTSGISGEENNRQLTTGFSRDVSPSETNSKFKIEVPKIELPKGGGAIKGIEEKFNVNAITGTSSFSIPIPLSPSRHGFVPAIGLSYNSGNGNSPFGMGWQLDIPSISRKTEKELPQYRDEEESDTFILSGAEDLVPA